MILMCISFMSNAMNPIIYLRDINFIVKGESPNEVSYTIIHNTQNPIVRWELKKNKQTQEVVCKQCKTYYHTNNMITIKWDFLPKEYFDYIQQKYDK